MNKIKKIFYGFISIIVMLNLFNFTVSNGCEKSKKIRVGYIEGEEYFQFSNELSGIALGLQEEGVISGYNLDENEIDSKKVWEEICDSKVNGNIEFVKDMYFNMSEMDYKSYSQFINSDKVDLIIVMGTVAGKLFVENEEKNDFMIFTAANAINAGLVKSESERYKDNSFAHVDSTRFKRQLEVGHNLIGFKKIGVVYEDTPEAYAYSAIDQMEELSKKHGFDIVRRHVVEAKNDSDYERYYMDLKAAYKDLANEIDTLYITTSKIEDDKLPWLLEDIYDNNIPTIAQSSEKQVENGALLHVTIHDPKDQGRFAAKQVLKYINGTPINELEQKYEITPKIVINYDIAREIDFKIPFKTLLTVDKIYSSKVEEVKEK